MTLFDPKDNTFAVVDSNNYVVNIVYVTGSWDQPADTILVQLYEYESCNIGDYYFPAGTPPTGRFAYVSLAPEYPTFESTLPKPKTRTESGGSDSGSLFIENSIIIGTGNSGAYVQFADGSKLYSAIIDGGSF